MSSIGEQLKAGFEILSSAEVAEPGREASLLLMFALGRDKTFLVAHPEYQLTADEAERYRTVLERRAGREPFQYIVGRQEFFGLDIIVTPDVLIPRPETEVLVEEALRLIEQNGWRRFCEVGVGSGCISVAILKNSPETAAIAGDISSAALAVARQNAEAHGVTDRLELRVSNVFDGVEERFDLIVSNPPYIPLSDIADLQAEVRDHEPHLALTDGSDGLSIVRRIEMGSRTRLYQGGAILIEIGWDQSEGVAGMFEHKAWKTVEFLPDLAGIPRILKAIHS